MFVVRWWFLYLIAVFFIHLQGVFFFVSNIVLNQEVTRTVLVKCTTFLFFCLWPVIMSFRSNVFHVLRPLIPSSRPFLSCHLYMYHLSVLGVRSTLHQRHSRFSFIRLPYFLLCFTFDLFSVFPQLIALSPKLSTPFPNSFLTYILNLLFLPILTFPSAICHYSVLVFSRYVLILVRFKLFINSYGLWFAHHICHCLVVFFYFLFS